MVEGGENARYDTLTDGIMSTFHHELFHSLQRNINLNYGGDGEVDGEQKTWQLFSEGTAVLVSSVGQPVDQFTRISGPRAYMSNANSFLGGDGLFGDLNRSYERVVAHHTAIYWRFLYEQCGGKTDGVEHPTAGMDVIRRALTTLYSGEVVDIGSSTDLVKHLPQVMDRALRGSACPFQTYEQSLVAFARAIYALRLDGGRCTTPGAPVGCGFYDPNGLYHDPPSSTIVYTGTPIVYAEADQAFPAGIGSSFGMDFVEVVLDPAVDGQPLVLELYGAPGADAEFGVRLWKLMGSGQGAKPRRVPSQMMAPEILRADGNGRFNYVIPAIDTGAYNRLGLTITRVDANESLDPVGAYTILLSAGAGSE